MSESDSSSRSRRTKHADTSIDGPETISKQSHVEGTSDKTQFSQQSSLLKPSILILCVVVVVASLLMTNEGILERIGSSQVVSRYPLLANSYSSLLGCVLPESSSFDPRTPWTSVFDPLPCAHCHQRWCKERSQGMTEVSYESYISSPFGRIGMGKPSHLNTPADATHPATIDRNIYRSTSPRELITTEPEPQFFPFGREFLFALVADRDTHSICEDDGQDKRRSEHGDDPEGLTCKRSGRWSTHVQRGMVRIHVDEAALSAAADPAGRLPITASIELTDRSPLSTHLNANGRAIELSELHWHRGRFLTICDYTGVVYTLRPLSGEIFPRFILADGDGREQRTIKGEWMAAQGSRLVVGSHGKEWVEHGVVKARGGEYVKVMDGSVRSVDWQYVYKAMRAAANATAPGYLSHEAAVFLEDEGVWVFAPRKRSSCGAGLDDSIVDPLADCGYDDELDEMRGANILIRTPNFNVLDVLPRAEESEAACRVQRASGSLSQPMDCRDAGVLWRAELERRGAGAAAGTEGAVEDVLLELVGHTVRLSAMHPSVQHLPFTETFLALPAHLRVWATGIAVLEVEHDGSTGYDEREWGYASLAPVPGSRAMLATKVYERAGATRTRLCVLDSQGRVYSRPCPEVGEYKYEGMEVIGTQEHF